MSARVLDVTAANGVPFRVVLTPAGETPRSGAATAPGGGAAPNTEATATFYDRRYPHTEHGQFTGGHYTVRSLLGQDPETFYAGRRIGSRAGLDLHGGVAAWTLDQDTAAYVAAWLENDGRRPTPTPAQALSDFITVWAWAVGGAGGEGIAQALSCTEANVLADLLCAHGEDAAAGALLADHSLVDDEGDDPEHYALQQQEHRRLEAERIDRLRIAAAAPSFVPVYITSDDEPDVGATDRSDVSADVAAVLDAEGLTYAPDDAPDTRYSYVGKGDATWRRLVDLGVEKDV